MSCTKADAFLAKLGRTAREVVDAKKVKIDGPKAIDLALTASKVVVVRGSKETEIDDPKAVDRTELSALLLGPTGNLRAPTLRVGKTLMVGFQEAAWKRLLR